MRALVGLTLVLSGASTLLPIAANADPTFGNLFERVACNLNNAVSCEGDFCRPDDAKPIKENIVIDYVTKQAVVGNTEATVEIVGTSEAALGKPLWVRSRVPHEGKTLNIQTTYLPRGAGAHQLKIGVQTKDAKTNAIDIMTGQCRLQQRPRQ